MTTGLLEPASGNTRMPASRPHIDTGNTAGKIAISDVAVGKLASRAVLEVSDAGGATPRVLGRAMPGAGHLGIRETSLTALPKASADVDGALVYLDVRISVRWPASVPHVTARVREHLRTRVQALTGLTVAEVGITVDALVVDAAPTARVR
jgi:uncharacterized alkaline shock family protein YloU